MLGRICRGRCVHGTVIDCVGWELVVYVVNQICADDDHEVASD